MSTSRCIRRLNNKAIPSFRVIIPSKRQNSILKTTAPVVTRRQFHNTPSHLRPAQGSAADHTGPIEDVTTPERNAELALEEELLAIQDAAIAELEANLGKSLQSAIEDDQLADRVLAGTPYGEDAALIEAIESPLSEMRSAGSSIEEIVREARNIFGDYLPHDVLSEEEFLVYKRLYGEPSPEPDETSERLIDDYEDGEPDQEPENILYNAQGEQLPYRLESAQEVEKSMWKMPVKKETIETSEPMSDLEAIAQAVQGNLIDAESYDLQQEEEGDEADDIRSHPLTKFGKFGTSPRTTYFPRDTFVRPVEEIMGNFSNKHLKEMCEKTFGGPGLPDSPLTPRSGRSRPQIPIPLEAGQNVMSQMEANAFITTVMPPTYASISAILSETRKRLGASWLTKNLAKSGGPRILDAGSGGVGILAWRDIVRAHWDTLHSSDQNPPPAPESKSVVLAGSDALRHRVMKMLENTTFIPRLPDYIQTRQTPTIDDDRPAQDRKKFDVIIASHSLFALKEEWERKQYVQNLWSLLNEDGGVLVLIEKGIPRGFETIAAARQMLLHRYIETPEGYGGSLSIDTPELDAPDRQLYQKLPGMIVAPCTNHTTCPLYRTSGISRGRKDICSFQQRYVRPPFLQRVLGAKDRNHDDVDFSYLSVIKGMDLRSRSFSTWDHVLDPASTPTADSVQSIAEQQKQTIGNIQRGFESSDTTFSDSPAPPPAHNLPRIINHPLKRQAHVTMDLCTPTGEIRRWTVPKSFSRQAYRDARKARWGDLWALGAKTDVPRNLKTGVSEKDMQASGGKMVGKPRSRKERIERQAQKIFEAEQKAESEEAAEERELMRLIEQDDLLDAADEDERTVEGLLDMDTLMPKSATPSTSKSASGKPKHNQAKLHNINIFGKTAMPKQQSQSVDSTSSPPSSTRARNKAPNRSSGNTTGDISPQPKHADATMLDSLELQEHKTGDYDANEANLADWADSLYDATLEDQACHQLNRTGRRPTSRNTYRLKKELRRLRKENGV